MWHVVPLLDDDGEISNYTNAVTRQRPLNSKRGTVFYVWSMPRCFKQDNLGVSDRCQRFSRCELLLLEIDG
jgi:hypothetical protein